MYYEFSTTYTPSPWGRLHNAGCAGVGCTRVRQLDHNSGTYSLDEPLGGREGIYIYIYYFQFTVYILRSCSLSIPIDQAAYLVQDSI